MQHSKAFGCDSAAKVKRLTAEIEARCIEAACPSAPVGSGNSKKALWICIPISLLMIALGTFMGYGIYAGRIWDIPASEALRVIQNDQELMDSVMADFGKTVAFWGVSIVISLIRSRKKK